MFFFLSKFLPVFIYPLGLACVLLGLTLWLRRYPRLQKMLVIITLLLLCLAGNKLVTMMLTRSLEWQYVNTKATLPQAEVIVVLGGGTRPAAFPRHTAELNGAGNRLFHAAWLYKQEVAPLILVSGGNATFTGPASQAESEAMTEILVTMGIPREAILLESISRNTRENALETQAILEKEGLSDLILITSASHMPRAYRVFTKVGLQVTPSPTDFTFTQDDWVYFTQLDLGVQLVNLPPNANNLEVTSRILKEYVGFIIYGLRGWL